MGEITDGGTTQPAETGFLRVPPTSAAVQRIYDEDIRQHGFVMNLSRLWAHQPAAKEAIMALLADAARAGSFTVRQRGILITACASTLGDAYCSLAWGSRLARDGGDELAAAVLRSDDDALDASDRALAVWARKVSRDPNTTTAEDVEALRHAGFDDDQIFAATVFVALRMAFSTVNNALGAAPDGVLHADAPVVVREAVTFGRPAAADAR